MLKIAFKKLKFLN